MNHITLALDLAETSPEDLKSALNAINGIWKTDYEVEPVHVLDLSGKSYLDPESERKKAQLKMYDLFKEVNSDCLKFGKVLLKNGKSAAQTIINLAKTSNSIAVVTLSKKRSDFSRLMMGSFSKALSCECHLPILSIPAESIKPRNNEVLFATDLSEGSYQVLLRFVKESGIQTRNVKLFYKSDPNIEAPSIEEKQVIWRNLLAGMGINNELILDQERGEIADSIVRFSNDRNLGLIAMASDTSPDASKKQGSVTDRVFALSDIPVWVFKS